MPPPSIQIELTGDQLTWLQWMRDKYALGSSGYVLLLLIDYCSSISEAEEHFIFTVIRCKRCGIRFAKREISMRLFLDSEVEGTQDTLHTRRLRFLELMLSRYDIPSLGKVVRIMLDWVQTGHTHRRQTDEEKRVVLLELERRVLVCVFEGIDTHTHGDVEEEKGDDMAHLSAAERQVVLTPLADRMAFHVHRLTG